VPRSSGGTQVGVMIINDCVMWTGVQSVCWLSGRLLAGFRSWDAVIRSQYMSSSRSVLCSCILGDLYGHHHQTAHDIPGPGPTAATAAAAASASTLCQSSVLYCLTHCTGSVEDLASLKRLLRSNGWKPAGKGGKAKGMHRLIRIRVLPPCSVHWRSDPPGTSALRVLIG
jgi:hypothetical protein